MTVNKGLRRFDRSRVLGPRAGHAGHQSGMPDSIPLPSAKCPPWHRNTVRHHSGMLSAISPEFCPSCPGLRNLHIRRPINRSTVPSTALVEIHAFLDRSERWCLESSPFVSMCSLSIVRDFCSSTSRSATSGRLSPTRIFSRISGARSAILSTKYVAKSAVCFSPVPDNA
jgi:hypothetical protein